jgi:glycolate oxidase iron-sulfur subunit
MDGPGIDPDLVDACVHCGFCLPACPTYQLWGEEMDSPRGRIHLMRGLLGGDQLDGAVAGHVDACLGCLACVTACPSGVQYGALIEATRVEVEVHHRRTRSDRAVRGLVFALFPHPRRLRALVPVLRVVQRTRLDRLVARSVFARRVAPRLVAMAGLAPSMPARSTPPLAPFTAAVGTRRATVMLLTGCVQGTFFPNVNAATQRVLAAEGCDVDVPGGQGCCGALSQHAGRHDETLAFARALIDRVDPTASDAIVTNAAGCGSTLKGYGDLLRHDPAYAERAATFAAKVVDAAELLDRLGPVAERHPLPVTVAYHDACHLAHGQGVRAAPRRLLEGVPGVQLREVADGDTCCGSAGIYNIVQPEPARELGARKARAVRATGADLLVAGNPGCLMQIRASLAHDGGANLAMVHTIELLDASLRDAPVVDGLTITREPVPPPS